MNRCSKIPALCCLLVLNACQPVSFNQSQPPASSAQTSGQVPFDELKGYSGIFEHQLQSEYPRSADNQIDTVKVFRTQAEFEAFFQVDPDYAFKGVKPDPVDFSKSWVLVTAKMTSYAGYDFKLSSLKLDWGNLWAEATVEIRRSADVQREDYIRPVYALYRIDGVAFKGVNCTITKASTTTVQY